MRLWCIHGNLQQPSVWLDIANRLQASFGFASVQVELENLWMTSALNFHDWADDFCQRVQQRTEGGEQQWLMGYSLGGRLALHAIVRLPQIWKGAIVVSADPGLKSEAERTDCLQGDLNWGQRFLAEPWDKLLREWDGQGVFAGYDNPVERHPTTFDRHRICQLFDRFSKGRQANLSQRLAQLTQPPLLYVSGVDDPKYCAIGQTLANSCATVTHTTISHAAHRVPWDNPSSFATGVAKFIHHQNILSGDKAKPLEPTIRQAHQSLDGAPDNPEDMT